MANHDPAQAETPAPEQTPGEDGGRQQAARQPDAREAGAAADTAHQPPPSGQAQPAAGEAAAPEHPGTAPDTAAEPASREDPARRIDALEAELARLRAECEQHREQALRAAAEADNVRKRAERDLESAHRYALERFVAELLPVKDSLELGLAAAGESAAVEDLREGTEMTLRLLSTAVEKFGVREVDPVGAAFDPQHHQAMSTRESGGAEPGTVLEVVQKGYLLNDRLVRPALVVVAK